MMRFAGQKISEAPSTGRRIRTGAGAGWALTNSVYGPRRWKHEHKRKDIWARGHSNDWNHYAELATALAWNYDSILTIYRSIESYNARPDTERGTVGPVAVHQPHPYPVATFLLEAARPSEISTFPNPNGKMMEAQQGVAISGVRALGRERLTIFEVCVEPFID